MSSSDRTIGELLQQLGRLGLGESGFLDGQVAVDLKRAEQRAVDVFGIENRDGQNAHQRRSAPRTCSSALKSPRGSRRDPKQAEIGDCRAALRHGLAACGGRRADLEVAIRIVLHVVGRRGVHLAARSDPVRTSSCLRGRAFRAERTIARRFSSSSRIAISCWLSSETARSMAGSTCGSAGGMRRRRPYRRSPHPGRQRSVASCRRSFIKRASTVTYLGIPWARDCDSRHGQRRSPRARSRVSPAPQRFHSPGPGIDGHARRVRARRLRRLHSFVRWRARSLLHHARGPGGWTRSSNR